MGRFDQIVDTLAFGQTKPKEGTCLGLYLSPELIYISETHLGPQGKLIVDHLVRIQIPLDGKEAPASTMTMSVDFLSDPAKVAGLIREAMAQIRWNSKNVVVTLSHHFGLLRYFPMPSIERRYFKSAVPLEAKKYIPIPFNVLTYDYQVAPMPPDAAGKPRQGVLIAVSQKKNLTNILGLLQALGMTLIGLEVAPCSVLRLWQAVDTARGPAPFVQAHFDGGSVRILICDRGLPVFFREVFLGGAATLSDQRKVDLSGCLAFAQKQLALSGISKIELSGTLALLGPWREALAKETGLPTAIQDTAKLLTIKGGDWGGYAAIGASARNLVPSGMTIDLSAADRVSDDERQTARDLFIAGLAMAALIALVGLFDIATYSYRARALNAYKVSPEIRAALSGLQPADIDLKLKEMSEQLDHVRTVTSSARPHISALLRDIIELMPENAWLSGFSASNPLLTDKEGIVVTLRGRARGASVSEEQNLAAQFKDTLLRSAKIGKLYDIQISLESKRASPAQTDQQLDPVSLARKLEERTAFVIELRAKR